MGKLSERKVEYCNRIKDRTGRVGKGEARKSILKICII